LRESIQGETIKERVNKRTLEKEEEEEKKKTSSLQSKEAAKVVIEKNSPGVQLVPDPLEVLEFRVLFGQAGRERVCDLEISSSL